MPCKNRAPRKQRSLATISLSTVTALLLSSCGGSAGSDASAGSGEGFEYGAPQEEVNEAIEDLEPVTLTYQPGTSSPNTPTAANALAFIEAIEERSEGKINFEVAWGQSIADHGEIEDALADGRIDIAFVAMIYQPDEYPVADAFSKLTHYSAPSPLVGEVVSAAMMSDLAWNNEELMAEYTAQGLVPLSPMISSGDYYTACNEPGTSLEDWQGRQMRIAGSAHSTITEEIGATGVSMAYNELFEALQRGTVDCTFTQPQVAGGVGIMESAPYLGIFSDRRMTGSATAANLAGAKFQSLPLAYQQIIFDAQVDHFHGNLLATMDAALQMVHDLNDAGGEVATFEPDAEARIQEIQENLVDEMIADGRLDEGIRDRMPELEEKWTGIVEELGYEDGGSLADLDEWYEEGSVDFRPVSQALFEDAALPHRPQ
jgi:TRAP-type C4-dicarboxylate transport system substrate-binding protein